jgi:hypothetical protein
MESTYPSFEGAQWTSHHQRHAAILSGVITNPNVVEDNPITRLIEAWEEEESEAALAGNAEKASYIAWMRQRHA